jgi:sugar lactone lactonase YvrE
MRSKIAILMLLPVCTSSTAHAETPAYAIDQLLGPRPVCCSNGMALVGDTLYVNHAALDAVDTVDVDSREITTFASEDDPDSEELVTPDDLWRDPDTGDIYFTEILVNGVRKIAPDGTRTRVMSGFGDGVAHPNAITGLRRPDGTLRLFISMVQFEPGTKTGIWEIDPLGIVPPRLVYGAAAGQVVFGHGMRAPNAMEFDPSGRELFVPESYGGAVWAIDVDAHTSRKVWDGAGPDANGIALRFARDGGILYAEQSSGRLLRLDPEGPHDQAPQVLAQLDPGIDGVAEHADGRIFLSNFRYGGVSVVHPDGTAAQLFPRSLDLPEGIVPLDDGRLAIADLGSLALVDPAARTITRPKQFIRDDYDIPLGVGTTGGCDTYSTAFFRGTLQHVDACDPSRPHTEILPRKSFAVGLDVAGHGPDLWVSDAAGIVWRVMNVSGSAKATAYPLVAPFVAPTGIALGDGVLFVSDTALGLVRVVDPATGVPLGVIDRLDEPEGLYAEADGSLLIVEAGAGRLTRAHPDGARETLADGLATRIRGVSVVPVLNFFADVTELAGGTILVTSPLDGSITRLTPS